MTDRQFYVYIMTNKSNQVLYTGVTSDLKKRAFEHREGLSGGFTRQYNCKKLVWYEECGTAESAILREKQIKGGSRAKKLALVSSKNHEWHDLYDSL